MKPLSGALCPIALLMLAAGAPAQTICTTQLAQVTSPTPGSTLPAGAVTFAWCHANGDYFLDIESVPGAHDIFFAFLSVESITLGPACNIPNAISPTTQCIVPSGETIYVTLWTNIAQSGRKNYVPAPTVTFTAANSSSTPAATATIVDSRTAAASAADQNITLTANVTGGAVNQGAVTFQVLDGAAKIGAAVTSATLTNGSAAVTYLLPGGTPTKVYSIQASYSGGTNFQPSSGTGTLTVTAPVAAAPTATAVAPQTVAFNSAVQTVALTAAVTAASAVNEGTVTFQMMDGAVNIGSAASSGTLLNGNATVSYALPAGLAAKDYTIVASYSGGTNFLASSGLGVLTVSAAPPATRLSTGTTVGNSAVVFSSAIRQVTLTAAVTVAGATLNQGTVTFQVMDNAIDVGAAVPSAPLNDGSAAVSYALPAGLPVKAYSITASYSGGPGFLASSGTGTLAVTKAPSTTVFSSNAPASLPLNGKYAPTASSTGDGILTIGAGGSCSITGGVVTITSSSGTCTVTAVESEGNNFLGSSSTPQSIQVAVVTTMSALEAQVAGLNLKQGEKNSLMSKLQAAQASLDRGNTKAAANQLGAFVNQVQALEKSGRLDAPVAASLIAQATGIVDAM